MAPIERYDPSDVRATARNMDRGDVMYALCSIDGCGKSAYVRGWCVAHYGRWKRHGDPCSGRTPEGTSLAWMEAHLAAGDWPTVCVDWPFDTWPNGYGRVWSGGRAHGAHRLALEGAVGGAPADEMEAAHSCGRRICVNPNHLRWATRCENEADKLAHGTHGRGKRRRSKFTDAQAAQARARYASGGVTQRQLADEFGVSQSTISYALHLPVAEAVA